MAIDTSEIIWKKVDQDSDLTTNGGRITHVVSPDATANNDLPDVPQSELTSGVTRYRKRFIKIANDADLTAQNTKIYMRKHTPADDALMFFPGTQRDTQASIVGTERLYGCGQLGVDASAGATTLYVNTEGVAFNYFRDGDKIIISNKGSILSPGDREECTITGAPTYGGDQATITITAPLVNSYLASNTIVSSVYEAGNIAASADNYLETSASGTYDEVTYPVVVDHIGTVEQTWTVTFTSATAFNVVGDTLGSAGSGTTAGDFAPVNTNESSKPFFTLLAAGWGGTWAISDTFVFQTHPCAVPIWYKQVVPAACAAFTSNLPYTAVMLQSA